MLCNISPYVSTSGPPMSSERPDSRVVVAHAASIAVTSRSSIG